MLSLQTFIPYIISFVMFQQGKPPKQKLKTLCTIDTADIDLGEGKFKSRKVNLSTKNKNSAILAISDKASHNKTPKNNGHPPTTKSKQKKNKKQWENREESFEDIHQNHNYHHKKEDSRGFSCSNSRKSSKLKYIKAFGDYRRELQKASSMGSSSCSYKFKNPKISESLQKRPCSKSKQKLHCKVKHKQHRHQSQPKNIHHKTEYSNTSEKGNFFTKTMNMNKTSKFEKTNKNSKLLLKTHSHFLRIDENYRTDFYVVVESLQSSRKEYINLIKMAHMKKSPMYLLKRTKDKTLKAEYRSEVDTYKKIGLYPLREQKYPKNILKLQQSYRENKYECALYEHAGACIDWENNIHQQIIRKILKNEGVALKYIIRQIAKGIHQLSKRGFCHSNLCIENIILNIAQKQTTISLQGNIKLADLHKSFHISQKKYKLSHFQPNIYTPPEIINYMIFQHKNQRSFSLVQSSMNNGNESEEDCRFDRELIQFIGVYDEPWYSDVWSLGIIVLELLAGQSISIEKCLVESNSSKNSFPSHHPEQDKPISLHPPNFQTIVSDENQHYSLIHNNNISQLDEISVDLEDEHLPHNNFNNFPHQDNSFDHQKYAQQPQKDIRLIDDSITLHDILTVQKNILSQTQNQIQLLGFDEKLQSLLIRMLSSNPLIRPSPKEIIAAL